MDNNAVNGSIIMNAPISTIWEILTNPGKIALYTGSQVNTDWSPGSPIVWEGEMHGATYQNKGAVLENNKGRLLRFTYWSGMGGDKDLPENYSTITYTLNQLDNNLAELTYSRINIPTVLEQQIFEQYLPSMLQAIKKLAEE